MAHLQIEQRLETLGGQSIFHVVLPEAGDLAALEGKGYTFLEADVQMVPQNYVKLTDEEDIKNMEKLIDALEDNDDVQNVYHNWEQD